MRRSLSFCLRCIHILLTQKVNNLSEIRYLHWARPEPLSADLELAPRASLASLKPEIASHEKFVLIESTVHLGILCCLLLITKLAPKEEDSVKHFHDVFLN